MAEEEKLTPELRQVYDYMRSRPCEYVSVREVRLALALTNGQARYRLWRLVDLGLIVTHLTYVVRPRIRRRWFHYIPPPPKFYKSHCIVSLDYFEEHILESHIIFPHLQEEITKEDEKLLATLAFELLADYGVPETFLLHHGTSFNLGEVQTKPVQKFNEQTEASIFDVKRAGSPVRRSYRVTWKHEKAWTEVTLTGEKIEHPAKISYTTIEEIGTIGREELKEKWKKLAEKEAIQ